VRCSAVAAVVGSSTRAAKKRKRRKKGSKTTMSHQVDDELCEASARGDVGEIELLVAAGADPNAFEGTDQMTPLQTAALNGHVAAIAVLLKAGAHVDGERHDTYTALMLASWGGHAASARSLLAVGANVHHVEINCGFTTLHFAAANGYVDIVLALLDAGARVDVQDKAGQRPIEMVRLIVVTVSVCSCV